MSHQKTDPARQLSDYIDALNAERKPSLSPAATDQSGDLEVLMETVRAVRRLRGPAMPDAGFSARLAGTVQAELAVSEARKRPELAGRREDRRRESRTAPGRRPESARPWFRRSRTIIGLAAVTLAAVLTVIWSGLLGGDLVHAMNRAVAGVESFHGVLEVRSQNALGEEWPVRRVELRAQGESYAMLQHDGTYTVNNGERKWQVRPDSKEVILLPPVPDPTPGGFSLGRQAESALRYPHQLVGYETVAGRRAAVIRISPPGGLAYRLWIDTETRLPVQLETPMQNGMRTFYTFVSFEPNVAIEPETFVYEVPDGYSVVDDDPGQEVASVAEAAAISGLTPPFPSEPPQRAFAYRDRIVLDYGESTVVLRAASGPLAPEPWVALGTAAGGLLEVIPGSLRWQQEGVEVLVQGLRRIELARQIAEDIELPDPSRNLAAEAQIPVPVDIDIAAADQRQVDGGHSPWQLDPLHVALVFVNLQVSPGGIQGEYPVGVQSLTVSANTGLEAVVEVDAGPIARVYLKKVVRQDETGIWSAVGYDPR